MVCLLLLSSIIQACSNNIVTAIGMEGKYLHFKTWSAQIIKYETMPLALRKNETFKMNLMLKSKVNLEVWRVQGLGARYVFIPASLDMLE